MDERLIKGQVTRLEAELTQLEAEIAQLEAELEQMRAREAEVVEALRIEWNEGQK